MDFQRTGPIDATGIGNIELGVYYNFLNRPETGTGLGAGFEVGFPEATDGVAHDAFIYEPFFVAYQEIGAIALNLSAGVEIEDPRERGEDHEVAGDIAVAAFRRYGEFIPLIELGLEIEDGETDARIAPGVYWNLPCWKDAEIGVAFPIGLTADAPDFGAFLQLTIEFEPEEEEEGEGIERPLIDLD